MSRIDTDTYDVAIVGYGPTGVTAANMLGASGLRVVAIERDADIYSRARAISTDEDVIRIWQSIGLADRLKQDMLAERPIDFVDADGRSFLSFRPKSRGTGHPPQLFIYQPALERVLRDGVDRYPNVEILLEHESLRVRQDGDEVDLTLLDLRSDTVKHLRARYVIACDGGASPTRALLGIGFEGKTYEDRWVVIDTKVRTEWDAHDRLRFHCNPERPAVDCPTPLGHHRWEFPVLPGDDEAELVTEPAVRALLAQQGITDEHVEVQRAVIYSHHVRFASRWRIGRVFFAGDAAHVMPPWIGQGMAAGVRDAANLCWKLAAVLQQELPEAVLDSYETERQPHVRAMTKQAVFFGRIITERRRALTAIRDPLFRLLNRIPPVRDYFRDARWFPAAHYPDGYFGTEDRGAAHHQIPQPTITVDGEPRFLDDILEPGWCILHTSENPDLGPWADLGLPSHRINRSAATGALADSDGVLVDWLAARGADIVVLRPDRFVYAAAATGSALPGPPAGFKPPRDPA